ncbi:OLC1v1012306C3 [Oldenlandia corymbosa var. corymbosa]|uniref:OLC1v1012306C3 n=1 Tax=Oldenlandia corymbosa var. corymbosa TaxID=529605 RepID=A0AAV1DVT0_OLDCO|nr:OLC1v1012306C3 [Oldenlandia corymbosa var. corymbosa]
MAQMTSTGIDSGTVEELGWLENHQSGFSEVLRQGLRFLIGFLTCMYKCEAAQKNLLLRDAIDDFNVILKEVGLGIGNGRVTEIGRIRSKHLNPLVSNLVGKFEQLEPKIKKIRFLSLFSLRWSNVCLSSAEILGLLRLLLESFQHLVNLESEIVGSVKNQIRVLIEKLSSLRNLVRDLSARSTSVDQDQELEDFRDFVKDAASLSLVFLLKGEDNGKKAQGLETLVSDLLHKFKPCAPKVAGTFIRLLKASESTSSDKFQVGKNVVGLVDFLLEELVGPLGSKDRVEIVKEGLIVIISFFVDPGVEALTNSGHGFIIVRIKAAINEVLYLISLICMDVLEAAATSILLEKIETMKAEIRKLYFPLLSSSPSIKFPTTNCMGFIDFLLENLEEMMKRSLNMNAFVKHRVLVIHTEILSLKPFLQTISKVEKERGDLGALWKQITNTMFLTEQAINSCLLISHPIWYDLMCLSDVKDSIKLIEREVKTYKDQLHGIRISSDVTTSTRKPARQSNHASLKDVVMMGREDEFGTIIQKLCRGTEQLDIVSIVGMAGLGKTTMAQKVYNDSRVKFNFPIRAWCCVSQTYKPRECYFDILSDVIGDDGRKKYSGLSDNDLVEKIWKELKQRKYLIVLDDIWSIDAWEGIKCSFPDDGKGSRIMFTTRIHDLVSQAMPNSSPHQLQSLSDEESWELLQSKLPLELSSPLDDEHLEIGKKIAKNCKGLPLAVVLVAGILAGKDISLWKHIESSTSSELVSEMCMDVLELSYEDLTDSLKSCFLYFAAFPEDTVIRSEKLKNMWIAEGLIPRTDQKSSFEIANEYLSHLISRNLIILEEASSTGDIKACRVHDLLHNLCLVKSREDNFMHRVDHEDGDDSQPSKLLIPKKYEHYRLCVHAKWEEFVKTEPVGPFVHSLVVYYNNDSWQFEYPYPSALLNSFTFLKVLDLELIEIEGCFPEEVTLMVHLRYLAISCDDRDLPSSIVNLWNLETLILPSQLVFIPEFFWKMKSLRYVHIDELRLDGIENHKYGKLEKLEVLSRVIIFNEYEIEELLRRLPALRKLTHTSRSSMKNGRLDSIPTPLESLSVVCFPAFDFPSSLRKLTLDSLGLHRKLVSAIGQLPNLEDEPFPNLKRLIVNDIWGILQRDGDDGDDDNDDEGEEKKMVTGMMNRYVRRLPNLEVLKLNMKSFKGNRWHVEVGEFLNLTHLELNFLDLKRWTVQDETFPSLERLIVSHRYKLRGIPYSLGYIHLGENRDVRLSQSFIISLENFRGTARN